MGETKGSRESLPADHRGIRWFFASLYLTTAVIYLLFRLEMLRRGESGPPWPFGRVGPDDAGWIALLLLGGLTLVNAWLLDGLMELRTLQEGRTRAGVRAVRFFAVGIPLVGIYVMPVWLWLLERRPEWAVAPLSARSSPSRRPLVLFSSRTQWLRLSIPFFISLLVGNFVLLGAGVAWLGTTHATLFGVRLIDHAAWMLRGLGLAAGLTFLAAQRSEAVPLRVPRPVPWLLLLSWMLPWPWCLAGALVVLAFDPQRRRDSLIQESFEGRQTHKSLLTQLGRRFDWWKLSLVQRFRWPSGRSPAYPDKAENRRAGLYRLKTFLLFPEAALFTAVLVAATRFTSVPRALCSLLLESAFYAALAAALAGALRIVWGAIRRRREPERDSLPPSDLPSWSLVLSALAAAAGIAAGVGLGKGDILSLGRALMNIGLAGMVAAFVLAVLRPFGRSSARRRALPQFGWLLVFASIGYAGAWLSSPGPPAAWSPTLITALLGLAPLASFLTGFTSSHWLLHPFSWRDLHDEELSPSLRFALAFLAVTAWAPGGGLATPLWAAARRRLWPLAVRPLEVPPLLPSPGGGSRMASLSPERRAYLVRYAIAHQAQNGDAEALFRQIETHPFFPDQANCSGGFRRGSEDIEEHILPLALQREDWERFLRYGALAVNLRQVADDLAEPDLLAALARNGHRQMALDAAARVADPAQRALGRAILVESLDRDDRDDADRKPLLELLRADLSSLAPLEDPEAEETRDVALVQIGLRLGPEILPSLEQVPKTEGGREPRAALLALSAAAGGLRREGGLDAKAWQILRGVRDKEVLAQFLPDLLGDAAAASEPARLLDNLSTLTLKPETLWACRLAILSRQVRNAPEEGLRSWQSLPTDPPLPWSIPLVERGGPLFATLPAPEIERAEQAIEDPVLRAALRVVLLEHRPEGGVDDAAQEALRQLGEGAERLHWTLRRLAASPGSGESRKEEVRAIGQQLFERQHRAPAADLRRYVELVARCLPEEIQRRTEDVVLSPSGGAPLLFHLAENCGERAILAHLFEHSEAYLSALVGLSEIEGARLWRALILRLTGRLCVLYGNLAALERAAEKLREADDLAAHVTGALADAGHRELAAQVCSRIRSNRLRLATLLRWLPETISSSRDLEPETLYRSLVSVSALEDEWLGLVALHDSDAPEILFQRYLDRIVDRDTQALALFRLAGQALDRYRGVDAPREKGQLVLQMLGQALGAMQSEARLAALTPWLPVLVARVDPELAIEEYREAFARLLRLHTVPWPIRRNALERLLAHLAPSLSTRGVEASRWTQRTCALFAGFETLLAEGISDQDESKAADLLPLLTAALERLPAEVAASLEKPIGSRLRFPDAESERVRALCRASAADRAGALETWPDADPSWRLAQALAYLLLREGPDRALALIARLPAGPQLDDLCGRLVAHGWVTGGEARELARTIDDPGLALETQVRIAGAPGETAGWSELFASFAVENGFDPSDPVWIPLVHGLWSSDVQQSRPALARAVLQALGRGSPKTAENALRLWMHAHLGPRQHQEGNTCTRALLAIRQGAALHTFAPGAEGLNHEPH